MQVLDYSYIAATKREKGYFAIPELDRYSSSVSQFIQLSGIRVELTKPTAFIYVEGFSTSQADSGINKPKNPKYTIALRTGSSYVMHKWISSFKNPENIVYANITSSTCASGLQALYDANKLLESGICEEVIVIGGERITEDTLRLFRELRIDIVCGDGFAYLRLGKEPGIAKISDLKWKYAYSENPFMFSRDTLNSLIPDYPVDYVKLHGTGSPSNTEAERDLEKLATPIIYKDKIGHSQGVSSILELCMVIDSRILKGKILAVANGLGGWYGSCTVTKD